MLTLKVPGREFYDKDKQEFVYRDSFTLELEHSLVSLSKWESKYEKPFLSTVEKTGEELLDYAYMMILTPNTSPDVVQKFSEENVQELNNYLGATMTATWFNEAANAPKSKETITAELIYYWMSAFNIDIEMQHWHLSRLLTLIRVHNLKGQKPKKMGRGEALAQQRALNAQRLKDMGTRG